jgi:hypothetical protein
MGSGTSQALNSEQGLTSIPTAQGGLARLAIARLESTGVPAGPLLGRAGLTPEAMAKTRAGEGQWASANDVRQPNVAGKSFVTEHFLEKRPVTDQFSPRFIILLNRAA